MLPPEVELETLQAISSRFGGKHQLRIDPNGRWTVETAVEDRQAAEGRCRWNTTRTRSAARRRWPRSAARTGLPMSTNMCVDAFDHIPPAVQNAAGRCRPGRPSLLGRHSGCQELGRIAPALGWKLSQHSNNHAGVTMAAMIHLGRDRAAAHDRQRHALSLAASTADIIAGGKLPIRGGQMKVPAGPGLGVELDRDKLAQAHETYSKCGMRDRDDAAHDAAGRTRLGADPAVGSPARRNLTWVPAFHLAVSTAQSFRFCLLRLMDSGMEIAIMAGGHRAAPTLLPLLSLVAAPRILSAASSRQLSPRQWVVGCGATY